MSRLAASISIALVVHAISLVQYYAHLALLAATGLVFAAIGSYVAFQTAASEDTAALGSFVYISLGLARVGLGAAGADVLASEGV